MLDFDGLRAKVAAVLDGKRYIHTLGCEETAAKLAVRWGTDENLAREAALLHDITKLLDMPQQLKLCYKYGIVLDDVEKSDVKLMHAITGAEVAADVYGAGDAVCSAVRWHTTGRAGMSLLEKIVYMADYIEPTREFDEVERLRSLAFEGLDAAVVLGLGMTIIELVQAGKAVHPFTVEARNALILAINDADETFDFWG